MGVTASGLFLIIGAPAVLMVIVWALIGAQRPSPKEGGWYADSPVLSKRRRRRRALGGVVTEQPVGDSADSPPAGGRVDQGPTDDDATGPTAD